MLYEISFDEDPENYNIAAKEHHSVIVDAPTFTVTEDNISLPPVLIDWATNTFAAQFGYRGELKIKHFTPVVLFDGDLGPSIRPTAAVLLQTFKV